MHRLRRTCFLAFCVFPLLLSQVKLLRELWCERIPPPLPFPRASKSKYRSRPFPAHLCFLTAADFLLFLLERVMSLSRYYPR